MLPSGQLGEADLGVGVDEGLLVDAPDALIYQDSMIGTDHRPMAEARVARRQTGVLPNARLSTGYVARI